VDRLEGLKKTIAVLFRRKGKDTLTEKEFVFSASIDMRWFSPKAAQRLLDLSLKLNLISKSNGELRPNFDMDGVSVPMDFKPGEDILDASVEDVFSSILGRLKQSAINQEELLRRIDDYIEKFGIEREVAALMLGKELGIDLESFHGQVEDEIAKRAGS
jgi:hypothetical protein